MNLRESNTRIALLSTLAKKINEQLAKEREGHLGELLKRYDEDGTKSFTVLLPGEAAGLGSLALNDSKPGWAINDATLLEWAKDRAPMMVKETIVPARAEERFHELWPAAVVALEKRLDWTEVEDEDGELKQVAVDTSTGQIVPGAVYRPAGKPTVFQVRLTPEGKVRLIQAWASGRLNKIAQGALPQIAATPEPVKAPVRRRRKAATNG